MEDKINKICTELNDGKIAVVQATEKLFDLFNVSKCFLEFEEWFAKFEDEINIELAETGADREMDFDNEREFEKRYEMYLNAR